MNSVVTGAAGFIGSHVVDALLLRGDGVRALVRGSGRPIPWHAQGAEVVVGDLRDADTARAAVHGAHTVYHCAAAGDNVSRQELHDTNVGGLRNLLEAMRRSDARRLVLMSGLSVLGLRNWERMTEELPTCPCRDPEIQAKLEAEALAWEYQRAHGIEVSILRAGFVYGPRDRRNLPQLLDAVRKWTFIYIGSRRNVVPLVHVSDLAAALLLAGVIPQA